MKEFKDFLRENMEARGLRAADLCRATGIPKGAISYYLAGKSMPKVDRLVLICDALDVSAISYIGIARSKGKSDTRLWRIWRGMRQRCNWPGHSSYKYYGAKGVTVCPEWNSFNPFYEWAVENGYRNDLTLDRIDPTGNYEPKNCRWATYKEQAQNKRSKT